MTMKVISSVEGDVSTFEIMDWLWYLKKAIKPIYLEKSIENIDIQISDEMEDIVLDDTDFNKVTGHLHRQGDYVKKLGFNIQDKNAKIINIYLSKEWEVLKMFLHSSLEGSPNSVGTFDKEINNNKLSDLLLAKKVGFKVPKTLITTQKTTLQNFYIENNNEIITKPLRHAINVNCDNFIFSGQGTKRVTQQNIDSLDDNFFPVFVQEEEKNNRIKSFCFSSTNIYDGYFLSRKRTNKA